MAGGTGRQRDGASFHERSHGAPPPREPNAPAVQHLLGLRPARAPAPRSSCRRGGARRPAEASGRLNQELREALELAYLDRPAPAEPTDPTATLITASLPTHALRAKSRSPTVHSRSHQTTGCLGNDSEHSWRISRGQIGASAVQFRPSRTQAAAVTAAPTPSQAAATAADAAKDG
jgi:hypothetical protein